MKLTSMTATITLVAIAAVLSTRSVEGATVDSCHLREFDLCMTSAVVFVQQPQGSKVSEAEIEKQCGLFRETEDCLDTFEANCVSKGQHQLIDFASGGILQYMKDYCKKGSNTRKLYLKHGDCVNKQRKQVNKCLIDFQAAIEKATVDSTHWKDRPKTLCCALDRYRDCNAKIIEPACGKDAIEVGETLIKATFSRAATVTCDKYKFTSAECKSLLPPLGTKPLGAKSGSVLSKLMSTMTQT